MDMDWFRSWHGAPTDNKFLAVARRAQVSPGMVSAVFWALLDYASQADERGSIDGFDVESYAIWAGWEETEVAAVIAAMQAKEMVTGSRLTNWEKRQPRREENSTPRVKAFRERQALQDTVTQTAQMKRNETHGNADGADETHGNAPESESESEEMMGVAPTAPPDPFPSRDPDWQKAIAKLESNWGAGMSGSALLELAGLWPDLRNGQRGWLDDAIDEAVARHANTPVYAIRVLANAVRQGKRPGEIDAPRRGRGTDAEYKRKMEALLGD